MIPSIARLSRFDLPVRSLLLMAAIAPLAVSRTVIAPRWDDAYFLERAVCVNRAVFNLSPTEVDHCLSGMMKSPLMSLLLLPAGPLNDDIGQLGVATFLLAFVIFVLAILLASITHRMRMPFPAFAAAALALAGCGSLRNAGAPFLVDGAYALLVAIALQLPMLEHGAPAQGRLAIVARGMLWGAIASAGMLSKVTFGLFGALVAPLILFASVRQSGARATLQKSAVALATCLAPGLVFARYADMYIRNGWRSAYGDLATYYGDGLTWPGFLKSTIAEAGAWYLLILAGLLVAAIWRWRGDRVRLGLGLASAAIALLYMLLVSISINREARFLLVGWLVLPLAVAGCLAPGRRAAPPAPLAMLSLAFAFAVAAVASLPMASRFDLQHVRDADALLRFLDPGYAIRIQVASDPPLFNINTLQLAQRIDGDRLGRLDIRTVIYDATNGHDVDWSERQLRDAHVVMIVWPVAVPPAPEFTNRHAARFLDLARKCGHELASHPGPADVLLFDMRNSPCTMSAAAH